MKKIPLSKIDYDPQYYPRVNGKEDWMAVARYKEALEVDPSLADPKENKKAFPPIVVVWVLAKKMWMLLDGLHRVRAFHAAGLTHIYAEVETIPKSKWMARAAELNVESSRALDDGDRAWICKRLEADGFKRDKIAKLLVMKMDRLERIMIERPHILKVKEAKIIKQGGRSHRKVNGKSYGFLKAPYKGLSGTNKGTEALMEQGCVNSSNVLQVLREAIAIARVGVIDMTDEETAAAVVELVGLLEPLAVVEQSG